MKYSQKNKSCHACWYFLSIKSFFPHIIYPFNDLFCSFVWIVSLVCLAFAVKFRVDMKTCCMLVWLVRHKRDLMWQQPTLACVCVSYHSRTFSCHTHWIWQLLLSPSFCSRFFSSLCLFFASLQTDSENRSLVRWRIRDGNRQGRALCKNCRAILMMLQRAKPAL